VTALARAQALLAEADGHTRRRHDAAATIAAQLALGHAMVAAAEAIAQLAAQLAEREEPAA
jgi:hypothetical protein